MSEGLSGRLLALCTLFMVRVGSEPMIGVLCHVHAQQALSAGKAQQEEGGSCSLLHRRSRQDRAAVPRAAARRRHGNLCFVSSQLHK